MAAAAAVAVAAAVAARTCQRFHSHTVFFVILVISKDFRAVCLVMLSLAGECDSRTKTCVYQSLEIVSVT